MTGRPITLNAAKGGINRQRTKGGASASTLYMLLNGYVDSDGVLRGRDGHDPVNTDIAGTKGLCAHNGALVVFAHQHVDIPASTPAVQLEVLVNKNDPDSPIKRIHFAAGYMGYLYVAAEFENGDIWHYWLQKVTTWQSNTIYGFNDAVQPSVPNGYTYFASRRGDPYPTWAAGEARAMGDKVEPTTANSWYYEVSDVIGDTPRSGDTEPTWPTEDGGVVYEDVDLDSTTTTTTDPDVGTSLPSDVADRYSNSSGSTSVK